MHNNHHTSMFKGLPLFGFFIFQFKNAPTPLCLSRDKTKGHSGKNATLTPTKILPKKQDYSSIIFQIALSTYKLNSFFKKKKKTLINQILKIKTLFFCKKKKKASPHALLTFFIKQTPTFVFKLFFFFLNCKF